MLMCVACSVSFHFTSSDVFILEVAEILLADVFNMLMTCFRWLFEGGDPLGQFGVEHTQGEWKVLVRKPLDREETDNYHLNITATDGTFTARAVVEVKVLDANDNGPVCEKVRW